MLSQKKGKGLERFPDDFPKKRKGLGKVFRVFNKKGKNNLKWIEFENGKLNQWNDTKYLFLKPKQQYA